MRDYARAVIASHITSQLTCDLTDEQIKNVANDAVWAGALSWTGFEKDERGFYTVPSLSKCHYQFARAIARAAIAAYLARQPKAEQPDTAPITDERIFALWAKAIEQFQQHKAGVSVHPSIYLSRAIEAEMLATAGAQNAEAIRNQALSEAILAAEKVQDMYYESQSTAWPELRDDAATGAGACVDAIRDLQTGSANTKEGGASGERSGK
jgi:hypothetical protein